MSEAELRRRLDSVTEQLLSAYEELEVLTAVAEIAASSSDVSAVGRQILGEAADLLQAEVAFVIYSDAELKGEEPAPKGITPEERDALGEALGGWLEEDPRPEIMAPFTRGASVPHAPDALLAVPLKSREQVLGAICLGRRGEGETFTAGDLKILSVLGSSAAAVLLQRKNLDLVRMARHLEERNQILQGIHEISREIAASLDLDRLLHALANLPTRALGFDRCAVMLEEGARRRLRAVSGAPRIDRADPEMRSLEQAMDWVAGRNARVLIRRPEGDESGGAKASSDPDDAMPAVAPHMAASGSRALLAIPLVDDQGMLGVIAFESAAAEFIDEIRLEGATILANQATVAIRNARLYGEVPFIGMLAPLRKGIRRVHSLPRRRLAAWGAVAVLAVGVLIFGHWNLRVPGQATVLPQRLVQVSARARGVVGEVARLKEGDLVQRGTILARLEVPDLELRLGDALAREETALRTMGRLEAEGNAADLRLVRVEAERWKSERENLAARLEEATLRAPVDGVLLTPRLAERTGELLDLGGIFCTMAEMEPLKVEIAVREADADVLVRMTEPFMAALKFDTFPDRDYQARIDHVRSSAEMLLGQRVLIAEGRVIPPPGTEGELRPGMTGRARLDAGSRPLAQILFRKPYRFVRSLIWL